MKLQKQLYVTEPFFSGNIFLHLHRKQALSRQQPQMTLQLGIVQVRPIHYVSLRFSLITEYQNLRENLKSPSLHAVCEA